MLLRITHTYRASFSDLSRETWLLSLVMLVNRAGTMVVPFMSMYITQRMHRSIADAGLIITLFGAGAVLGSSVSGYFIDRISFRAVQIFSSITGGILFLLMGQINNFTLLVQAGGALVTEQFGYNVLWGGLVVLCIGCALGFKLLKR